MDEKGVFERELIDQFFHLGLMGIEVPEQYGGAGGKFFEAILAVEEISRVDASAGVIVDVQNTLVNNALLRWTTEDQKRRYLPKMTSDTVGAYALSEASSGSDAFAPNSKAVITCSTGAKCGSRTAKKRVSLSCSPQSIPQPDTKALPRSSWKKGSPDSASEKKKTSWESALPAPAN
jgi:hypothetical protein